MLRINALTCRLGQRLLIDAKKNESANPPARRRFPLKTSGVSSTSSWNSAQTRRFKAIATSEPGAEALDVDARDEPGQARP